MMSKSQLDIDYKLKGEVLAIFNTFEPPNLEIIGIKMLLKPCRLMLLPSKNFSCKNK